MFQSPKTNLTTLEKNNNKPPVLLAIIYLSNRKVDEAKILCKDALSINLTLSQFLDESITTIKRS
jgi:hypothetical protein